MLTKLLSRQISATSLFSLLLGASLCALWPAMNAAGAISVLENRTEAPVQIVATATGRPDHRLVLQPGDARPIFHYGDARVEAKQRAGTAVKRLAPQTAYVISRARGGGPLTIWKLNLGDGPAKQPKDLTAMAARNNGVIAVKLLVDDDEVRRKPIWETELRKRIARASDILTEHSGIRLRVVAVQAWDSDDQQHDFSRSLREFEREVSPSPAQLAIGFSSQYKIERGRYHLGGTRAALHSHILLKERARNVREPEKVELLTHELGHFLGATHSSEETSVMRPVIREGVERSVDGRIRFDAANTLLIAMMGEEIRFRGVKQMSDISPNARRRMSQIYAALEPRLPNDPAAGQFRRLIAVTAVSPVLEDARKIRRAVYRAAAAQHGAASSATGDRLLESYVRAAALEASRIDRPHAAQSFVLALGIAIDDTGALANLPIARGVAGRIESPVERRQRTEVLGKPTLLGRKDLAKHFFVSATLTGLAGDRTAHNVGLAKELLDSNGGSGFSFADMAANRAGIVFAQAVLTGQLKLTDLAANYTAEHFMPPIDDLREALNASHVVHDFGAGSRLNGELQRIERRILQLPVYQGMDFSSDDKP